MMFAVCREYSPSLKNRSGGLKGYLTNVIGNKNKGYKVYTLKPNRSKRAAKKHDDDSNHVEFLEEEIQVLVSDVRKKIDSLPRKCCEKRKEENWRTGCGSCHDAAEYRSCGLDVQMGKRNNSRRQTKKNEPVHNFYKDYHENLRHDDYDHVWQLRMHFSKVKSCINDCDLYDLHAMGLTIQVPRAYRLIRILQLLSLPRYYFRSVPEEILHTLSTALAGPYYRQLDNSSSQVSNLKVVGLDTIHPTLGTMQFLRNILVQSESLEQLHLNWLYLPDAREGQLPFVQILADGLERAKSTHLKVLRLSGCGLTDDNLALLVSKLHRTNGHNTSERYRIETLNLNGNFCQKESLTALGSWLEQPDCSLRSLNLSCGYCESPVDLSPLSRALKVQSRQQLQGGGGLQHLDLHFSAWSDQGVRILAEALKEVPKSQLCSTLSNCTPSINRLKSLFLATNRSGRPQTISCRGLQHLGESLPSCHSLQYLDLSYTSVDPAALNAFCNGLAENNSISDLTIQRLGFAGFPQAADLSTSSGWISSWGGTQLPHYNFIPSSSPTRGLEYLCQVLVTSMPLLKKLDISYSIDVPAFFFENVFQMKLLEQLLLLGYTGYMTTASEPSDDENDQALIRGVSKSTTIVDVHGLSGAPGKTQVEYYTRLNKGGRKYLNQSISSSLWPRILEKSNQHPALQYRLLREGVVSTL